MEKYLIIYGHKDNNPYDKSFTWRETKEAAESFKPDWVVFQIIYVPEGKGY